MDEWRKTEDLHPPENERVLVFHSGVYFYSPCIATYYYATGGGGRWNYELGFFIGGEPEFWKKLDIPQKEVELTATDLCQTKIRTMILKLSEDQQHEILRWLKRQVGDYDED